MGAASLVASEKFGLEVNSEKKTEKRLRFIVISCELNGGKVTTLRGLRNVLKLLHSSNTRKATNKSKLHYEEIKEQLTFRQSLLPAPSVSCFVPPLLSNNIKVQIYRTVMLLVVLHGFETWSVTGSLGRYCGLRGRK
jgi:hypothetical protein